MTRKTKYIRLLFPLLTKSRTVFAASLVFAFTLVLAKAEPSAADPRDSDDAQTIIIAQQMSGGAEDHSQHQGDHEITPEMFEELREKSPIFREMSDDEIRQDMAMMPNFDVYLSDEGLTGEVGVLALAHGFGDAMNTEFEELLEPVARSNPTAVAYGMAMMTSSHAQKAVDRLVAAGAKKIIVVPVETLMDSKLFRQWQYIFGLQEKSQYLSVARVETESEIILADKPTTHPLVAEIMLDHARELSVNPEEELLILVSHGPVRDEDNVKEMEVLEAHAAAIRKASSFAEVKAFSMQDDAPTVVRDANVQRLRSWIEEAAAEGKRSIVVTNLIMLPSFSKKIKVDLEGLDYRFNTKGIVQHPSFAKWVQDVVEEEGEAQ